MRRKGGDWRRESNRRWKNNGRSGGEWGRGEEEGGEW